MKQGHAALSAGRGRPAHEIQATQMTDEQQRPQSEVYREARRSISQVESLADTPWSKLFHEARTAKTRIYSGVSLPVAVRNGNLEVGEPVKTRQGEHLRASDAWDGVIHLPTSSFMRVETARSEIRRQLRDLANRASAREERIEKR